MNDIPGFLSIDVLDRYFANELPAETRRRVEHWLTTSGARDAVSSVRRVEIVPGLSPSAMIDDEVVRERWAEHQQRYAPLDSAARDSVRRTAPRVSTRVSIARPFSSRATPTPWGAPWGRVLGGAVLLASLIGVMIARHPAPASRLDRTYATRPGERESLELPDGSHVVLAPATSLHYRVAENGSRVVELRGQAYFAIAAAQGTPFSVQAGVMTARVLGTTFAIRAYPGDTVPQIAVAEGKVAVAAGTPPVVLLAGDVARVRASVPPSVMRDVKMGDVFGWMHGRYAFDDVPLRTIADELDRLYDLDIRFRDPWIAARPLTLVVANQDVTTILDDISTAADLTYTRHGRVVEFSSR